MSDVMQVVCATIESFDVIFVHHIEHTREDSHAPEDITVLGVQEFQERSEACSLSVSSEDYFGT